MWPHTKVLESLLASVGDDLRRLRGLDLTPDAAGALALEQAGHGCDRVPGEGTYDLLICTDELLDQALSRAAPEAIVLVHGPVGWHERRPLPLHCRAVSRVRCIGGECRMLIRTEDHPDPVATPSLSIVVVARDRCRELERLITVLAVELADAGSWELIVVDHGSIDGTAAYLRRLSGAVSIVGCAREVSAVTALAEGLRRADGALCAVIDPSMVPEVGALAGLLGAAAADPRVPLFAGTVIDARSGRALHTGITADGNPCHEPEHTPPTAPAASLFAVRREAFDPGTAWSTATTLVEAMLAMARDTGRCQASDAFKARILPAS